MSRIVVGVDGSEGAMVALEWAVAEAKLRDAELEVVHTFAPADVYYSVVGSMALNELAEQSEQAARESVQVILDKMADKTEGVDVTPMVMQAHAPAPVLVERSRTADLLVVGSRGRGGFTGLLLGSVSQQCAQHASCPVVVVPMPDKKT